MKNPRRSPEQTRAAEKQRLELQRIKDEEMSRKMNEAYERTQRQSVSGMNKGGVVLVIESGSPEMEDDDMEYEKMGAGGSLKMVDKGGEKVPFFAADGKGKMKGGGYTYAKGGMTRGGRDGCAIRGKTKGRMV